jgi:hypothetical protein
LIGQATSSRDLLGRLFANRKISLALVSSVVEDRRVSSAARTVFLVARRHVDFGLTRSMMCMSA